jgi:hypothetical protein
MLIISGALLGYSLNYYKSKYPSLLSPAFHDKTSNYPDEDNVSTGFFMASAACALLFISAIVNIVNVVLLITKLNQTVESIPGEQFHQQTTSGNKNGEDHD